MTGLTEKQIGYIYMALIAAGIVVVMMKTTVISDFLAKPWVTA